MKTKEILAVIIKNNRVTRANHGKKPKYKKKHINMITISTEQQAFYANINRIVNQSISGTMKLAMMDRNMLFTDGVLAHLA